MDIKLYCSDYFKIPLDKLLLENQRSYARSDTRVWSVMDTRYYKTYENVFVTCIYDTWIIWRYNEN